MDEVGEVDGGGSVDAREPVGVERRGLVLGFDVWPVWTMRLVGRAIDRLVVVVMLYY